MSHSPLMDALRAGRDARRGVRRDPILGDLGVGQLPSRWGSTSSGTQTIYRRDIRGGRQVLASCGWDASRKAPTWELTTHWHDARGREETFCETLTGGFGAADEVAK